MKLVNLALAWVYWRCPGYPAYRWPLRYLYCPCGCGSSRWDVPA